MNMKVIVNRSDRGHVQPRDVDLVLSFSPDVKPASIILLPILLAVTFWNCGHLHPYLRQALRGLLMDDSRTQQMILKETLTGPTYREKSTKSSTYGQALNTSITNHNMKKLPELLAVTFPNLPNCREIITPNTSFR